MGRIRQALERSELADDTLVVDAIRPAGRALDMGPRRNLLARFGLCGDTVLQTVGSLSGGERCRAALSRLAAAEAVARDAGINVWGLN